MALTVLTAAPEGAEKVLSRDALAFLESLHRRFDSRRQELLAARAERQKAFDRGEMPDFLPSTKSVRGGDWKVAPTPKDLQRRHVEITGPTERKMMINALNSGADIFMADFEDSLSPSWRNVVLGQQNCIDAVRRTISLETAEKKYRLNDKTAVLLLRPRGWHLPEKHVTVDGTPISASLFDFGLYVFHNARELLDRGTGPYFYLPKMESHLEARLWNEVFVAAQEALKIPRGSIRATMLIETFPAAFEMEEFLYEMRDHASGLNAGRWDYMFSFIKKFRNRKDKVLPDRAQVTMTVPFMRAYTELLVKSCHIHGAHAMGGMAPFIPSRKNPEINEKALAKVREDKLREVADGFDGTWVAHPDLVPTAKEVFDQKLGSKDNQKDRLRSEVQVTAAQLAEATVPDGKITEAGFRLNVDVALQYINSWLLENGAAAIYNLMEDAATAEISRAQLWQWIHHGAKLDDGRPATEEMYRTTRDAQVARLTEGGAGRYREAAEILDGLVLTREFPEFLTLPAYRHLD
ncbi:MAG TPA: malate synthase A [Myxococcaceae bacterium]|nr:malate synthase A [Myxococcaceae bacterium]